MSPVTASAELSGVSSAARVCAVYRTVVDQGVFCSCLTLSRMCVHHQSADVSAMSSHAKADTRCDDTKWIVAAPLRGGKDRTRGNDELGCPAPHLVCIQLPLPLRRNRDSASIGLLRSSRGLLSRAEYSTRTLDWQGRKGCLIRFFLSNSPRRNQVSSGRESLRGRLRSAASHEARGSRRRRVTVHRVRRW